MLVLILKACLKSRFFIKIKISVLCLFTVKIQSFKIERSDSKSGNTSSAENVLSKQAYLINFSVFFINRNGFLFAINKRCKRTSVFNPFAHFASKRLLFNSITYLNACFFPCIIAGNRDHEDL